MKLRKKISIAIRVCVLLALVAIGFLFSMRNHSVQVLEGEGDCVVVLHGLGRSFTAMSDMAHAFNDEGYHVVNIDYPSVSKTVSELAEEYLAPSLENCPEGRQINFVTHSLGGIMTRYYLQENPMPNLGRIVMVAPPNHGSEVADFLSGSVFFRWFYGPALSELGTDEETSVPLALEVPDFEFAVIAGSDASFFYEPFSYWLLPGDDDGLVTIESAHLRGQSDFLAVEKGHSFIQKAPEVIDAAINFLGAGKFAEELNEALSEDASS
jgi:triacylglycerol lipase